jgi:hypothetical protein
VGIPSEQCTRHSEGVAVGRTTVYSSFCRRCTGLCTIDREVLLFAENGITILVASCLF